jgi:hypothetical protein
MSNPNQTAPPELDPDQFAEPCPEPNFAIPGDRGVTLALWRGELAQPPLTTAVARWNWRQSQAHVDRSNFNRVLLPILNRVLNELTVRQQHMTVLELRDSCAAGLEE